MVRQASPADLLGDNGGRILAGKHRVIAEELGELVAGEHVEAVVLQLDGVAELVPGLRQLLDKFCPGEVRLDGVRDTGRVRGVAEAELVDCMVEPDE